MCFYEVVAMLTFLTTLVTIVRMITLVTFSVALNGLDSGVRVFGMQCWGVELTLCRATPAFRDHGMLSLQPRMHGLSCPWAK